MPEGLQTIINRIVEFWKAMTAGQKTRLYIMAGILVIVTALTLVFSLRVTYIPLFTSVDGISLPPVIAYLDENGIKYKKGPNNQILIDSKSKVTAEFDLSSQAIISPETSFADTWSNLSLTATEADKANLWKEFTKNDLVMKLKKFSNVENATVNYTKPDKSYWAGEDNANKGTAYVMLQTKSQLTGEQIDAASRVVASSLGILPVNVTLVDQNLNPLNNGDASSDTGRASTQEEMRRNRQAELEAKVRNHFLLAVGQNADYDTMTVSVNPVLDFDVQKSSEKTFSDPNPDGGGFTVSDEELKESLTNAGNGAPVGTDANPAAGPSYNLTAGADSTYSKDHKNAEKVYNEKDSVSEKALGQLIPDQSSMSITLWYGMRVLTADALVPAYLDEIRQSASAATGVPSGSIKVNIQKQAPLPTPVVSLLDTVLKLLDQFGFYVFMMLLLVIMAITLAPKKQKFDEALNMHDSLEPAMAGGPKQENVADISLEEQSEIKKQIDKFVSQKPDAVAQLLRNWLSEEWD